MIAELSPVGLGTWSFGGAGWGEAVGTAAAERVVGTAIEAGVTWFDTAPAYGDGVAERVLGHALRTSSWTVVTKVAPRNGQLDASAVRRSLAATLRRLGMRHRLVLLLHEPCADDATTARAWADIAALAEQGWVWSAGVSNVTAAQLERLHRIAPVGFVQNELSLLRREQLDVFATADRLGVTGLAYGALAYGMLASPEAVRRTYPESDWRNGSLGVGYYEPIFSAHGRRTHAGLLAELARIADQHQLLLPELAIRWCQRRTGVHGVIIGTTNPAHIARLAAPGDAREAVAAVDQLLDG